MVYHYCIREINQKITIFKEKIKNFEEEIKKTKTETKEDMELLNKQTIELSIKKIKDLEEKLEQK